MEPCKFGQRGTTFASQGNGQNDYTADRWAIGHNNSHMAAVTRATGPANDFLYVREFKEIVVILKLIK